MRPEHPGLRQFQEELKSTVFSRTIAGYDVTVAWAYAGSGKTPAVLHTAQMMYRAGMITGLAYYAPRTNLQNQVEGDWSTWQKFYYDPVMGIIRTANNKPPLTRPDEFGYVATYASLTTDNFKLHLAWAIEHQGQFLLVGDETQFLGAGDADVDDGPLCAQRFLQLAKYAAHVIIMTGSPYRSDGTQLILAEYSDPDEKGIRRLLWHVRATYNDGVSQGYLRPAQFILTDGSVTFSDNKTLNISELENRLSKVLRQDDIWQELADKVVEQLLLCRQCWYGYRALIACIDQEHAKKVANYLQKRYPNLKIRLAISNDGEAANRILKNFRPVDRMGRNDGDILVTVDKVSIGYDCSTICIVGNLSAKRWWGWLEQLFARGARILLGTNYPPAYEQVVYYVSIDDKYTHRFAEYMRKESERGLKDRPENPPPPPEPGPEISVIKANLTDDLIIGINANQDLDPEEVAGLRELIEKIGRYTPETVMAEIIRVAGGQVPRKPVENKDTRTPSEKRKDLQKEAHRKLAHFVFSVCKISSEDNPQQFRDKVSNLGWWLNNFHGVEGINFLTTEQLHERIRIIDSWIATGVPR